MPMKYVYEHWRPDMDVCFYVGKGSRQRAYVMASRTQLHQQVVETLAVQGLKVEVRIFASTSDGETAFQLEKQRIAYWRECGIALVNQSEGGPARGTGFTRSPEERAKVGNALRGREDSPEIKERKRLAALARPALDNPTRGKISASVEALWSDPAYREHMVNAHKGKPASEKVKERIGAFGRLPKSPEHKARIAAGLKAAHERKRLANGGVEKMPAGTGAKIAAANTGKKRSPETCARMKAAWAARKLQATI